jgi:hypothetical protein
MANKCNWVEITQESEKKCQKLGVGLMKRLTSE